MNHNDVYHIVITWEDGSVNYRISYRDITNGEIGFTILSMIGNVTERHLRRIYPNLLTVKVTTR